MSDLPPDAPRPHVRYIDKTRAYSVAGYASRMRGRTTRRRPSRR